MGAFDRDWHRAASGLRWVASAMIARLVLAAFALPTMLALGPSDPENMVAIAMLIALGALGAHAILVVGVFKFSNQPSPRPSAGIAQAAGTLGLVGVAIGFCVFVVLFHVTSVLPTTDEEAMRSALRVAETMYVLEILATVLGSLATVLFLTAIGSVATQFNRVVLVRKARTAIVLVLVAVAISTFIELDFTPPEGEGLVAALLLTTIVQIAAFASVLSAVRWLADVLRFDSQPALQGARA